MAGSQERSPFKIVIREIVNKFVPGDYSKPASNTDGITSNRFQTTFTREQETLFDDSEPTDRIQEAGKDNADAGNNNGIRVGSKGDGEDDEIFDDVETPAFGAECIEPILKASTDDPKPGIDERTGPTLESLFVTASGKSTRVSYEALQVVKRQLDDSSPPETPKAPSADAERASKGEQGLPVKVFKKAPAASKKVFDGDSPRANIQLQSNEAAKENLGKVSSPTLPSSHKLRNSQGASATESKKGTWAGFSTARGTAQKVSEKALRELRFMFRDEFPEVSDDNDQTCEPRAEKKAVLSSESRTAKGISESASKQKPDLEGKPLREADSGLGDSKLMNENTSSSTTASNLTRSKNESLRKEDVGNSQTPARRFAGLKRRTPMCQTPINGLSSPITPLRTPASSTPIRSHQQERLAQKKSSAALNKENEIGEQRGKKIKLFELTLLNRDPATADSTWFRDDISGRKVHLEDVKRSFRREINVRSSNFDLWFANHFEMVVWKLANYSGRVKELAGCLITENVLDQLKYRWNRELDGKRSPLRMIVERDASSEATLVLLVKDVSSKSLILSDGWYSIPCEVDGPLQTLISKGALRIGQKLCICGAQVIGAQNGVSPLELGDARLSIRFNSTRRARWHAKLGYARKGLLVPLSSVLLDGGLLPTIRVRVTSCSPLMYFEKFSQGGSVMRQEAAELKEQRKFFETMSAIQEKIREEVLRDIECEHNSKRVTRNRSRHKQPVTSLRSGEEIFNALENSLDPSQLMQDLSSSQKRMLDNYRAEAEEKVRARVESETRRRLEEMRERHECPEERIVAPLLKMMVCCSLSNIEVPLTVWRPSEDLRAMLRVGATVTIFRANVTTCRKSGFGLTTKINTVFEMFEESSKQQKPQKLARLE